MKIKITSEVNLKLFFFLVTSTDFLDEGIELCLGYDLETAFNEIKSIYAENKYTSAVRPVGSVDVDSILDVIERKEDVTGKKERTKQKMEFKFIQPKVSNEEQRLSYVCNLKYAADNFTKVLNDTDKKALNRIIKKIDKHLAYDTKQNRQK